MKYLLTLIAVLMLNTGTLAVLDTCSDGTCDSLVLVSIMRANGLPTYNRNHLFDRIAKLDGYGRIQFLCFDSILIGKITTISDSIYRLSHLSYINGKYNNLITLPDSLAGMQKMKLTTILFDSSGLKTLPSTLTRWTNSINIAQGNPLYCTGTVPADILTWLNRKYGTENGWRSLTSCSSPNEVPVLATPKTGIRVSPNPFRSGLSVSYIPVKTGAVTVAFYTASGKLIESNTRIMESGVEYNTALKHNVAKGLVICKVTGISGSYTKVAVKY